MEFKEAQDEGRGTLVPGESSWIDNDLGDTDEG